MEEVPQDLTRPLSPVLSNFKKTRKLVLAKRPLKKSRVKLTDRFGKISLESSSNNTSGPEDQQCKTNITNKGNEEVNKKENKIQQNVSAPNLIENKAPAQSVYMQLSSETCSFKTAAGQHINFSNDKMKHSLHLFDDILNPKESIESGRINKFSFISKRKKDLSGYSQEKVKSEEVKTTLVEQNQNVNTNFKSCTTKNPTIGFATASGKGIAVTEAAYKKALKIIDDDFKKDELNSFMNVEFKEKEQNAHSDLLPSQETYELFSNITLTENSIKNDSNEFDNCKGFTESSFRASQKKFEEMKRCIECIQNNKRTLTKNKPANFRTLNNFQNKFRLKEVNSNLQYSATSCPTAGFSTASGKTLSVSETGLKKAQKMFELASDENIQTPIKPLNSIKHTLTNTKNMPSTSGLGFQTAAGSKLSVSEESLKKAKDVFQNIDLASDTLDENIQTPIKPSNLVKHTFTNTKNMPSTSGLGFQTAAGSKLSVSEEGLKKAKDVFQNIDLASDTSTSSILDESSTLVEENASMKSDSSIRKKKRTLGVRHCKPIEIAKHKIEKAMQIFQDEKLPIMSPVKTNSSAIFNSTPIRKNTSSLLIPNITPIKVQNSIKIEKPLVENVNDQRFIIQKCTGGNVDSWYRTLENQKKLIEMKLDILKNQLSAESTSESKTRRDGILFERKQKCKKMFLKEYLKPGNFLKTSYINSGNAELVHFNCNQENVSFIGTLDGVRIVPNMNNVIGLSEIEAALKVAEGVDNKLIPQGWIRNHYKWIVWKLASYENFSGQSIETLTIENVVQQLKYRYDREIERAERSALRKIYEMDDSPQKRLVLCVSDIFNLQNGKFELELTDGWYSIRTVIDELLCKQVTIKKIVLGTKLIIHGAELLNCEGCHPLEAVDAIRLKINYNSTRRVKWYVKLGYQKFSEPFPIKLASISSIGGIIGCIKVYVARKYPVKYMEKVNNNTIWRNKRAEELRAQEWENRRHQDLEKLRETIKKRYQCEFKNKPKNSNFNVNDIKNVNCPETLWNLYENCKDPENQKRAIMDYKCRQSAIQQQEISRKIEECMVKNKLPERNITPVLQLALLDALHPNDKGCVFQIWRPSDVHLDTLKEGSIFYIYNVLPKRNGDLCTTSRTRFQICCLECGEFEKYKRTVIPISTISSGDFKPILKEFDTVGVVVDLAIDASSQRLWLTDSSSKLLLVTIFESPNNCLLLDRIKIGQVVAASNLRFCKRVLDFGEGVASESSVISCYPQQKHLQQGIQKLTDEIPKDPKCLLEKCRQKILYYVDHADITKSNSMAKSVSHSNNSEIFDESSDAFYSSIDVDNLA